MMAQSRRALFVSYKAKNILNKNKRADHWFWTRYSAYPYTGCQHGCEFCYCRERKYSPYDDPDDFAYVIRAKENAPGLLRQSLGRVPRDLLFTGDYQAAEGKFQLSRRMLEVCYDLSFPVFILTRSPLVLRDLELLQAIEKRARAVVAFSIISTPDSLHYQHVRAMERLAPLPERRYAAMEKLAAAGILTGTCFMPVLPGLCDDDSNVDSVVRWTATHGGQFILAGSLTLSDQQRLHYMNVLAARQPELVGLYQSLYGTGNYSPGPAVWLKTAQRVREMCEQHGIHDRMPRPIMRDDPRALNRRIVEALAGQVYAMELAGAERSGVWAYRKAAWAIEDLEEDVASTYRFMGLQGLASIENVGTALAPYVEDLIHSLSGR